MVKNTYEGVLEEWQVELIRTRARRRGVRGQDLDDAVQQVAIAVTRCPFDQSRSSGASETTVLTAIADRQLAMMWRRETRERQRIEAVAVSRDATYQQTSSTEVVALVQRAVGELRSSDRRICGLLADGHSTNEIAEQCGVSWHTADAAIKRIRHHLANCGLAEFVAKDKESAA